MQLADLKQQLKLAESRPAECHPVGGGHPVDQQSISTANLRVSAVLDQLEISRDQIAELEAQLEADHCARK